MPRKSALQTITASGFFNSPPSPRVSSSSLIDETATPRNPYILQDEIIPGKTPYTRRHHGKSSGLGLGSVGGGGKDGRSGGKNGGGGNQGQTDNDSDSSSSQDDEDADDDEGDGDEAEEPAVSGPVYVNGDDIARVEPFLTSQLNATTSKNGITTKVGHWTGPDSRKRSFSVATEYEGNEDDDGDDAISKIDGDETRAQDDGDKPGYPRKKVATELSDTNGLLVYHKGPPSVTTDDTTPDDGDDDDDGEEDEEEDEEEEDFYDPETENIEEAALIEDFKADEDFDNPIDITIPNPMIYEYDLEDPNSITLEELEDLDNEIFGVGWRNPRAFHDIQAANDAIPWSDSFANVEIEGGFFPENGSEISGPEFSTPFDTPNITPRGSISTAPLSSPKYTFSDISLEDNLDSDSDEGDVADLNPFFERNDPVLKHLVSTQVKGGWPDDSDDERGLWNHLLSEGDTFYSSEDFEADTENASDGEEIGSETDEGETTDEEENLPMPTPRSKSMLRRASISSISSSRPQVVHVDDLSSSGPTPASWVADPARTVCVIDGSRTIILPSDAKGYSQASGGNTLSQLMMEESESERSSGQTGYNPTLSGLTGGDGLFLNGSDILGPPEAFYPAPANLQLLFDLEDLGEEFIADDDEIDEFEHNLQITDFLDFSTDDGDGDIGTCNENSDGAYDEEDEDDDECVAAADPPEAMLALWDQVAVTSFRKRQIQHAQGNNNHANSPATPHKIGDRRLSQTITPARKKKLKQKYLANNKGPGASTGVKKKIAKSKSEGNFGAGNRWSPLFEGL